MDIAIVTGANSRIGLAISKKLIDIGCRVYGLGSDFTNFPLGDRDFIPVVCDLTQTEHLCKVVSEIIDREKNIYVLVNHARHVSFDEHEKQELNDLEHLVQTNLLAPMLLTRLALPSLIKLRGFVINVGFPDLPGSRRLGSSFLATETAMREFSHRLYDEVRQDEVRVTSLIIDSAKAEDLFKEGYTERDNHDLIVCSDAVAQAVDYVVSQKRDSVVSQLTVRPQKAEPSEEDKKKVRAVPAPKAYSSQGGARALSIGKLEKPKVKEISKKKGPTSYMDMARAAAAEEEALKKIEGPEGVLERIDGESSESEAPHQQASNEGEGDERSSNRRRRRRRGRNRNRNRGREEQDDRREQRSDEGHGEKKPVPQAVESTQERREESRDSSQRDAQSAEHEGGERRRRSRRRGRGRGRGGDRPREERSGQQHSAGGSDSRDDQAATPKERVRSEHAKPQEAKPKSEAPQQPARKATRKRPARKAAKVMDEQPKPSESSPEPQFSVPRVPAKKAAAKKAVSKKVATRKTAVKKVAAKKVAAKKTVTKKAATKKTVAKKAVAKKAAVKKVAAKKTATKKVATKKTAVKKVAAKKAAAKKTVAKKAAKNSSD